MKVFFWILWCMMLIVSSQLITVYGMTYQKWANENFLIYPLTSQALDSLKENTLVQGYTMDDERVRISSSWLDNHKGPQLWSNEFLGEMLVTVSAVELAKKKVTFDDPSVSWDLYQVNWLDPDQPYVSDILWKYHIETVDQLAEFVHLDGPTQALDDALEWLRMRWTPRATWLLQETPFGRIFTETVVCDESLVGGLVMQTSYSAFAAKYYFWFARPEELFSAYLNNEFAIENIDVSNYLDEHLSLDIAEHPALFTTYPEWAPHHPSRPAMHSAVASVLYALDVLFELDDYEKDQIKRLQSNVAFGRTFAGVHRPYDNIIGINMWIEVASQWLLKELLVNSWVSYDWDVLDQLLIQKKEYVSYQF